METNTLYKKLTSVFLNWLFLFIVWNAFTSNFQAQEVITGLIISFLLALFTSRFFDCCSLRVLHPVSLFYSIVYVFVFLIALIRSNFDMAKRVLSPSLPINPGIVKFKTKLQSDFAKMMLANSITLTPGTLSVDLIEDTLYVHWIDVKTDDPEKVHTEIAQQFENILLKIFSE
ncbi:MAG: Na+/H+ antiporter subunit E [Bacteroidota bacterium]|nr:Na+/H+ antiporter subunit E [Bacteroidota bacterium]